MRTRSRSRATLSPFTPHHMIDKDHADQRGDRRSKSRSCIDHFMSYPGRARHRNGR